MDYVQILTALYGVVTVIIAVYLLLKLYSVRTLFFDYISGFFKFLSNVFFDTKQAATEGPFKMMYLTICGLIVFGIGYLIRFNIYLLLYKGYFPLKKST